MKPQSAEFDLLPIERAGIHLSPLSKDAQVAELVDAPDSKSGFFGSGGSIPPLGTRLREAKAVDEACHGVEKRSRTIPKNPKATPGQAVPILAHFVAGL